MAVKDDILNAFTDDRPTTTAVSTVAVPALPTIQAMRENMALDRARRELLLEHVRGNMDAKRHAYDPAELGMGSDHKLRLTQDGARNLRGLYNVHPGEPIIEEVMDGTHLDVKVKIPLISMATGETLYWGTGFCSTRESKYAYRWIGDRYVPTGVDKRSIKSRPSPRGNYLEYQLPNEYIADQYHTVRQMAKKRAATDATMELPGVTEVFLPEGDAEEEASENRTSLLKALKATAGAMATKDRDAVIRKLFGIAYADLPKAPTEALDRYVRTLDEFKAAGINWRSPTLLEDLSAIIGEKGQQAASELFGEGPEAPA